MKIWVLPLLVYLNSCTTVNPQVDLQSFLACIKLCKKDKGMGKMQSNVLVNIFGQVQIKDEYCICKNSRAFLIGKVKE